MEEGIVKNNNRLHEILAGIYLSDKCNPTSVSDSDPIWKKINFTNFLGNLSHRCEFILSKLVLKLTYTGGTQDTFIIKACAIKKIH